MTDASYEPKLVVFVDGRRRVELGARVLGLLKRVGVYECRILAARQPGVLEVWFLGSPKEPIGRLLALLEAEPEKFEGTRQWTPIEAWSPAGPSDLRRAIAAVAARVPEAASLHVELHESVAPPLWGDVELVEPNPMRSRATAPGSMARVHVEFLGDRAGLSLLGPGDSIDVAHPPDPMDAGELPAERPA